MTLGSYFSALRARTPSHPVLDGVELSKLSFDALRTECARRRYGQPPREKKNRASWEQHFLTQQAAAKPMSLHDVAHGAGVDVAMVWRIEHGQGVGAETLRSALIDGLHLAADSTEVRQAMALWATEQTGLPMVAPARDAEKAEVKQFLAEVLPLLAQLDAEKREAMLGALRNPAVLAALPALVRLGEGQPTDEEAAVASRRTRLTGRRGSGLALEPKGSSPSPVASVLVGPRP